MATLEKREAVRLDGTEIGTIRIESSVDITDPCYDRDVWCRMDGVWAKSGTYRCIVGIDEDSGRVSSCTIAHEDASQDAPLRKIGEIGVDAGLAGFFPYKKDYSDSEWQEFCELLDSNSGANAWIMDGGFFTSSGYGDGGYDVYAHQDVHGICDVLSIRFIR